MSFTKDYLQKIIPVFKAKPSHAVLRFNPSLETAREEPETIKVEVFDYNAKAIDHHEYNSVYGCDKFKDNDRVTWINVDGLKKNDVEIICKEYDVHPLLVEDILSVGQRAKMDDLDNILFCLMNMLYYNTASNCIETEQVSIVLGKDFVLSFQEEANRDVFNPVREKLKINTSKLRLAGADYLCYSLIDIIVDNYYTVLELLGERIEILEEEIIRRGDTRSLAMINGLRKEMILLKRNVGPAREVINGFLRSDSDLLNERTTKYFKDVYDHIVQANDLVETYRDMMMSMQDLYLNKVNLRLNEVMKVMAIVTCLMAPATVIGGIFGMNFESIPYLHNKYGFFAAVALMLLIPVFMIYAFKKRGWFKR
ncbi:magnesium/cobalt transporter CorA [Parafilimonas sp.]|uniref:magnesium/cobalt transporter CorA n=1 Tax=Parafilimonas sp. TaxID=1969739 RepID=UPI0039E48C3D